MSSSPSRMDWIKRPPLRRLLHSEMRVFLMRPCRVAVTRYRWSFSAFRLPGYMAVTFSPSCSWTRFTTGTPFDARPVSGMA